MSAFIAFKYTDLVYEYFYTGIKLMDQSIDLYRQESTTTKSRPLPFSYHLVCFVVVALVAMLIMVRIQPEEGKIHNTHGIGISFYAKVDDSKCLHLHHWILCAVCLAIVIITVLCAHARWSLALTVLYAVLIGVALSDNVYSDLSLNRSCTICPHPTNTEIWNRCLHICSGS